MAEKDFLGFLVDETLKLQKSGECELSSLALKLKDYGLTYLKGEYIPQSQVLRFKATFGNLDIPVNWSVFDSSNSHNDSVVLDEKNDIDHFFSVLKSAWDDRFVKILVTHDAGFCYLVGLKSGEVAHLHDLLNPQEWLKSA